MAQVHNIARRGRREPPARGKRARRGADHGDEIRLVLGSRMEYLDAVHRLSDEIARAAGLKRGEAFRLGLAVREAFTNALTHGNGLDEQKKVRLSYEILDDAIRVCIADEGPGFKLEEVPDPLLPENLDRTAGRGLFLIRSYVDKLEVRCGPGGGSRLCLTKWRPRVGPRAASSGRKRT